MNLEQIDTRTTAGKARVMQLAAEGRKVAMRSQPGAQPMNGADVNLYPWVYSPSVHPSWNWTQCDYAIISEPVGPDELWVVHHKEGDHSLMSDRDHAEQWASTHKDDKLVRYIRADLAGEKG